MTAVEGRANALFGANAEALRMDVARMIAEVASFMLRYFLFYCNVPDTGVFSLICDASFLSTNPSSRHDTLHTTRTGTVPSGHST